MQKNPLISVVVPVYNEAGNIARLDGEIKEAVSKITPDFEVIYINDGSRDGSLAELKSLDGVTIIDFKRNYGQATAFDAGFKASRGDLVVSLDGDGQNDPREIPLLLEKLEADNLDVVAGWRRVRSDKNGIKILTRVGRLLRRLFIKDNVHDTGCSFRIYRSEAVKALDISGEMHRYILALLRWKGFRVGEVVVTDRARINGQSKYNYTKAIRGFIDLVYIWFIEKYSQRPLHFFGYMGLTSFFVSLITGFWTLYCKLFFGLGFNRNGWFFIAVFSFLGGIIFFSFGIVIDLLIRILFHTSANEERYYIKEIIKK